MKNVLKILILWIVWIFSMPSLLAADELVHLSQNEYIVKSKDEDTILIDIRTDREFEAGHIKGAHHLPVSKLLSEPELLNEFKGKDLVFYCHTGVRVKRLTDYLDAVGESENYGIYHLKGDYRAWSARQLPIER